MRCFTTPFFETRSFTRTILEFRLDLPCSRALMASSLEEWSRELEGTAGASPEDHVRQIARVQPAVKQTRWPAARARSTKEWKSTDRLCFVTLVGVCSLEQRGLCYQKCVPDLMRLECRGR